MEGCHCAGTSVGIMRHTIMPALVMLGLLGAASIGDAQARAPLAKFQPPGFFRIMVGDVEVTALHDGTASFDADKAAAAAMREHVLDEAASREVLVGAAHLPFPGLGHVSAAGTTWRWIAIDSSGAVD